MPRQDQDITTLTDKLLTMASVAIGSTNNAIRALESRDDDLARRVEIEDSVIDELEKELDELCITLLSRAPLAADLRRITVAMKITRDLERVGDEATAIARRAIDLNREPQLQSVAEISRMAGMAIQMLKDALDSFADGDADKAREIIPRDREVDVINKRLGREFTELMTSSSNNIGRALNLMAVSRRIERVADHATNIAEEVVYLFDGLDIRHTGRKKRSTPAASDPVAGI